MLKRNAGFNKDLARETESTFQNGYTINNKEFANYYTNLITNQQELEKRGRVCIFIDGSSLFYTALQLEISLDYKKLLSVLTAGSPILRAFFYTGVARNNEKQMGFLQWMSHHGYRVVAKDLVEYPDGSKKVNLNVEIAVDLLTLVNSYDTAVILSGHGDLRYAVEKASYCGAQIEIVSLRSMTNEDLIDVADRYTDIGELREKIAKKQIANPYHLNFINR